MKANEFLYVGGGSCSLCKQHAKLYAVGVLCNQCLEDNGFARANSDNVESQPASGGVAGEQRTANKLKAEIAAIADAIDGNYGDVDFVREQADKLRQLSAVQRTVGGNGPIYERRGMKTEFEIWYHENERRFYCGHFSDLQTYVWSKNDGSSSKCVIL